jgi:6-phosphogluconolactonase
MYPIHVFSDSDAMAQEIALSLHEQTRKAVIDQRVFSIVFSGGNTAPILYSELAKPEWRNRIPWNSVHIFFADERCVPPNNNESNYKMVSDHLINDILIPEANIHRIRGEENAEKEALRYAKDIKNHLALRKGDVNFFDWVLLGVGADGHTASLFPGQNIINSPKLCEVARHPDTGQQRITMTPAAINLSSRITYHCIGEGKSQIISKLTSDPSAKNIYPVLKIQGEWFLDKAAYPKFDFS